MKLARLAGNGSCTSKSGLLQGHLVGVLHQSPRWHHYCRVVGVESQSPVADQMALDSHPQGVLFSLDQDSLDLYELN